MQLQLMAATYMVRGYGTNYHILPNAVDTQEVNFYHSRNIGMIKNRRKKYRIEAISETIFDEIALFHIAL